MTKISLTGEAEPRKIRLEDDLGPIGLSDVNPRMAIWSREVVGVDQNGDRVYDWSLLAGDVRVAMYEDRKELVDGIELLRVKVVALHEIDVESTAVLGMSFGEVDDPKQVTIARVEKVFQNGVRLEMEGERVL